MFPFDELRTADCTRHRRQANRTAFKIWQPPADNQTMTTVVLLTLSNLFMTIAWYGHLKFKNVALWKVILASWFIAFFEYCLQVPANRIGSNEGFTAPQLKIVQEAITLVVFCVFAVIYLGEPMKWNYYVGFALVLLAVFFVFYKW
jgi:uncharacterized protein (DUF486 family)